MRELHTPEENSEHPHLLKKKLSKNNVEIRSKSV